MTQSSYPKVISIGSTNYTFILFEDGSAEFKKGIKPKESVHLNKLQVLDVYDELTRFYQKIEQKRLSKLALGRPCKNCGSKLTEEDVGNSLYGSHYWLCKKCASKISV
jgi:hypothetical protein